MAWIQWLALLALGWTVACFVFVAYGVFLYHDEEPHEPPEEG